MLTYVISDSIPKVKVDGYFIPEFNGIKNRGIVDCRVRKVGNKFICTVVIESNIPPAKLSIIQDGNEQKIIQSQLKNVYSFEVEKGKCKISLPDDDFKHDNHLIIYVNSFKS